MGGGPAGSSVASILAREGRKVILFEKEVFPRHHIGESLMTDTYWTFRRMGLLEKLKESPFVRKYSVQFANPAGKESRPFYFFEAVHHESAVTWQVTRAQFRSDADRSRRRAGRDGSSGRAGQAGAVRRRPGRRRRSADAGRLAREVLCEGGRRCDWTERDAVEQVSLARARSEAQEGRALFLFQRRASRAGSQRRRDAGAAHCRPAATVGSGISRSKTTSRASASLPIRSTC